MLNLKTLVAGLFALGLTFTAGAAHAEIVTYEFTATIDYDADPDNVLAYDIGDVVTGTFSYDTEALVTYGGPYLPESGNTGGYAYYYDNNISVDTGLTKTESETDYIIIQDLNYSGGATDTVTLIDFGSTLGNGPGDEYGWEVIYLEGHNDIFSGTSLPTTLSLEDFSTAFYRLYALSGDLEGTVHGNFTSLTQVGAKDVPELSASGLGSAVFLLAGAVHLLTRRRELSVVAA